MKKIFISCLILIFSTCTLKEQEKKANKSYFDIDKYFNAEVRRLEASNATIDKTVKVNGQTEQKNIKIINWGKELESFIAADINKASWKGEFKVIKNKFLETYTTNNEKIAVKKVIIAYKNDKIFAVNIFITSTNKLYTSKDSLSYYPDSLYQIKKVQQIKLMDKKIYQIIGKF